MKENSQKFKSEEEMVEEIILSLEKSNDDTKSSTGKQRKS